jgi:hypothetical protein
MRVLEGGSAARRRPRPLVVQALEAMARGRRRGAGQQQPAGEALQVGFGRIVVPEIEAPNMLVNLV